jgi:hypothetical protein
LRNFLAGFFLIEGFWTGFVGVDVDGGVLINSMDLIVSGALLIAGICVNGVGVSSVCASVGGATGVGSLCRLAGELGA